MDWNHEETEKRINKMKKFAEEECKRSLLPKYAWLTDKQINNVKLSVNKKKRNK